MTVPNEVNSVSYVGPQPAALAYSFRIFDEADLLVQEISLAGVYSTLVLNEDYTVTGVLSYTGGTVILAAGAVATGIGVIITRVPGEVQDTSLQSQGAYDAKVVENALDLLTMICQWLQNQVSRALLVPEGTTPIALPDPLALALLQWNASGTGLQNIPISDLGTILAAGNYVVDRPAFTAGVTTALTLTQAPGTVNNTAVFFDGVYQQKTTYTVSGVTITLLAAVPLGVLSVEVVQAGVLPINTPADNSVATATLQNLAVTAPKLADGNTTVPKLATGVLQAGKNAIINGDAILANGADYVASVTGTFKYGKSELCKGALTAGSSVSGTLTQVTNSNCGRTGRAFRWSAVTLTGTGGTVVWRFFIEAKDALRFKNQTATISARAYHGTTGAINYMMAISKATVADNFAAVTVISAGVAQSVPDVTDTLIYTRAVAMGDCSNGIQIDVTAACGAVSAINFDLTEVQLELSPVETDFEYRLMAEELTLIQRYFIAAGVAASGDAVAMLSCVDADSCISFLPINMRIIPVLASTTDTTAAHWLANVGATGFAGTSPISLHASTTKRMASIFLVSTAAFTAGKAGYLTGGGSLPRLDLDARF